jgi:hypothetical protein
VGENDISPDGDATEWTPTTGWSTPTDISGSEHLNGVSCPSTTECWAVGDSYNSGYEGIVAEWTPTTGWSTATDISGSNYLEGISCPSTTLCWAVGDNNTEGVVAEWTPTTGWSTPTDISGSEEFFATSCPSTNLCWAVGLNDSIRGVATEWTPSTGWGTATDISGSVELTGISCSSASECWTVGGNGKGSATRGPTIVLSLPTPPSTTDYNGNPLYPTITIERETVASSTTSCPTSGYSKLTSLSASTTSYSDDSAVSGTYYCYETLYQNGNWTSPGTLVGPLTL